MRLSHQKTGTLTGTYLDATGTDPDEVIEKLEEKIGGPTWTRTRCGQKVRSTQRLRDFLSFGYDVQLRCKNPLPLNVP